MKNRKDSLMKYIITGASSGIGKRCAERLLSAGNDCVLVARSKDKLDRIAFQYGSKAKVVVADFQTLTTIDKVFNECKELYPFDGLIHCAGIAPLKRVDENSMQIVREAYTINVFSFIEIMRNFVQPGVCVNGASVVSMSSVVGQRGSNRQSVYSGTKAALDAISRCMAKELLPRKIRVNTIVSGTVETEMLQSLRNGSPGLDEKIKVHSPLGIVPIDAVCGMIEYLLSDKASHITGASIPIDSGYLL